MEHTKGPALAEANARLIAAAPELLEACKTTEALLWGVPSFSDINKILVIIRKAITKAEGREEKPCDQEH